MSQSHAVGVSKIGDQFPWASFIGTIGFFLIFAIILCIVYVPSRHNFRIDQVRIDERLAILAETQAKVKKAAYSYAWVDEKNGTVRLPITRAMDILVTEKNKPISVPVLGQ